MPSVRYYNQTAPFWDWVASMEDQGANHPFFNRNNNQAGEQSSDEDQVPPNPWAQGWAGFPFGAMPHRGRHGHGPFGHRGQPPPPPADHDMNDAPNEKEKGPEEGPSEPRGPPPPFSEEPPHHGGPPHHGPGRHGHHGPGMRGRCGGRRGGWGGFGGRGRGPWGQPAFGPMGGFGGLAEMFQNQIFGEGNNDNMENKDETFKPEADVFDTAEAFIIHISLPGAKKEDVGVNWDSEKSELSIAGVVYRPGDEELLKTLALDERKVGMFERKVRLGSRANPAQVDVDGINAKLEDGILRVEVPKLDAGYVDVKKVDIE